jgi:hypothetical protein
MKKLICPCLICLTVLSSCKKSSSPAPVSSSSQTSGGTPYAELTALRSFSYYAGSLILTGNTAYADFRSDVSNISSMMQIGNVQAGGISLKYLSSGKTYQDTTYNLTIAPTAWQITGAGPIPSYTFTNNDSLPVYTGYSSLPDTIYKNQNLTLQITGIGGADMIEVSFYNSSVTNTIYQVKSSGISSGNAFTFSSPALAPLPLGGNTLLMVSVFKHNLQHSGATTFSFNSQLEISKQVYIK